MARVVSVPDFDFAGGFYYPEVRDLLIKYLRRQVPEISVEDEGEAAVQIMSAFALVAHLCNVRTDIAAHESLMVTSQLRDSIVAHLKMIGFDVPGDIPAEVELVLTMSQGVTATTEVVKAGSIFGTKQLTTADPVLFETQETVTVERTDEVTACFVYDESTDTYTDRTTECNTDSSTFDTLPAVPAVGDAFYIGHSGVMTNRLEVTGLTDAMENVTGVWEFSDDEFLDDFPDTVTNLGSTLKLLIDSMLQTDGSVDHTGLAVRVTLNDTGAYEDLVSAHDGTNNYVTTTGFLGQVSPSTDAEDYSVGAQWHRLDPDDDTNDGNNTLEQDGNIDFTLPKTQTLNWQPIEVNGVTAFWLRFRVTDLPGGTPAPATVERVLWDSGDMYVQVDTIQGRTVTDETVGSSSGDPDQEFELANDNVIETTVVVSVDDIEWTEVDDFLSSTSVDEHYTKVLDSNGVCTITFGDGVNGKVPPSGVNNITATYRIDADQDGNVGANTITVNRSGVGFIKKVTNPKAAQNWVQRRGADAEDRERLKIEGPASLRTLGRAVSAADVEYLTVQFRTSDGRQPFIRAKAIEEGFGEKTVKIVVVGPNGAATTPADRAELEEYFNGDEEIGLSGILVANQRVFARDYTAITVDVDIDVDEGNVESIATAITTLFTPTAQDEDDNYFFDLGGDVVAVSRIIATVFRADSDVRDVTVNDPAANVVLDEDELPVLGTLTINGEVI